MQAFKTWKPRGKDTESDWTVDIIMQEDFLLLFR